jgi:hypothetical protein
MDMDSCGEFHTAGLYFNEDKKLVIYNGRWTNQKRIKLGWITHFS